MASEFFALNELKSGLRFFLIYMLESKIELGEYPGQFRAPTHPPHNERSYIPNLGNGPECYLSRQESSEHKKSRYVIALTCLVYIRVWRGRLKRGALTSEVDICNLVAEGPY